MPSVELNIINIFVNNIFGLNIPIVISTLTFSSHELKTPKKINRTRYFIVRNENNNSNILNQCLLDTTCIVMSLTCLILHSDGKMLPVTKELNSIIVYHDD